MAALTLTWLTSPSVKSSEPDTSTLNDPGLQELRQLLTDRRYDDTVTRGQKYVTILESKGAADSLLTALVIDAILEGRKFRGPNDEVRTLGERAVAIKRAELGGESLSLADSLFHLGTLLRTADPGMAEELLEESLDIRRKVLGPDHEEVGRTLGNLSITLAQAGRMEESLSVRLEALATLERALGSEHRRVAASLNNLAVVQWHLGRYRESLNTQRRALAIYEHELPDSDRAVSYALINIGSSLWKAGLFAEARSHYERCLAALAPDSGLVSLLRNNLGEVYASQGDLVAARESFELALEMRTKRFGPKNKDVVGTMANLGNVERLAGNLDLARRLLEQATAISPKPQSLLTLGQIQQALGQTDLALETFRRARSLLEQDQMEHPLLASALSEEARVLMALGKSPEAGPLVSRALPILEAAYGDSNPALAGTLVLQGMLHRDAGRSEQALEALFRAENLAREHSRLTARSLSERGALVFARRRATGIPEALAIVADGGSPSQRRAVLDQLVRSRGIVLDEMARRHRVIQVSDDSELQGLSRNVADARLRLANLLVRGGAGLTPEDHRRLVLDASDEKEVAEQALARGSERFRHELEQRQVGIDAVSRALPGQSVLAAVVRYPHRSPATTDRPEQTRDEYLAFVLRAGETHPTVVRLGDAQTIDRLIAEWRVELGTEPPALRPLIELAEKRYRERGARLRQALWDPLAGAIGEAKQVFFVPDAAVHVVNFATLPVGGKEWLIDQDLDLQYLSTERDLLRPRRPDADTPGLLALGAPEFDALPAADVAMLTGDGSPAGESLRPVYRGGRTSCREFTTVRFDALPRARDEVREIGRQWAGSGLRPVSMLTGAQADEATFKREAPKWRAIHLATHGFFFDAPCLESEDEDAPENPLRLSGLALAGANRRGDDPGEGEDGILTAEEIASIDLGGVDWVVLSGCETGVGTVRPGEGVFGLRRAFEIAGADTLIMSLWPVEDDSARRWMEALYRHRLAGRTTAAAVATASREVLAAKREARRSEHPFYWGAFVATGNWR